MAERCERHGEFELRLGNAEKKIDDVDIRVDKLETTTALDNQKFTLILENLSGLPSAMSDIRETLILMKNEIREAGDKTDRLEHKFDKLNDRVCQIDSEGKLNLREWIKSNFIPLAIAISGILAWASTLV